MSTLYSDGADFSIPYLQAALSPSVVETVNDRINANSQETEVFRAVLNDRRGVGEAECEAMRGEVYEKARAALTFVPEMTPTQVATDREACIAALRQLDRSYALIDEKKAEVEATFEETLAVLKKRPPKREEDPPFEEPRAPKFGWWNYEYRDFSSIPRRVMRRLVMIALGGGLGYLANGIIGVTTGYSANWLFPVLAVGAMFLVWLISRWRRASICIWWLVKLLVLPICLPMWCITVLVGNFFGIFVVWKRKKDHRRLMRELIEEYERELERAEAAYQQTRAAYEAAWQAGEPERYARIPFLRDRIYRAVLSYEAAFYIHRRASEILGLSDKYNDRAICRSILSILEDMEATTFPEAVAKLDARKRAEQAAEEMRRHNEAMEAEARRKNEEQRRHNAAVEAEQRRRTAEQKRQYEEQRKIDEAHRREVDSQLAEIAKKAEEAAQAASSGLSRSDIESAVSDALYRNR